MAETHNQPATALVSAARTSVGDQLRTVVLFTPAALDLLYVREGVADTVDLRKAAERLVKFERMGFAEAPVRTAVSGDVGRSGVGPYQYTVRSHADGFVVRVLEGEAGVLLTTDGMNANGFEEAAAAIRRLLPDVTLPLAE
jgi:hypothetical protein